MAGNIGAQQALQKKVADEIKAKGKAPPPIDPKLGDLVARSQYDQQNAYDAGNARFNPLFGMNDPAMAEIMKARRDAAFGQDGMAAQLRSQGVAGINNTMSTGLRQLRGMQAGSGVRGGAALGQAMPILSQANQARSGLESNIAIADMERRRGALDGLESTVTGERAGLLGANFGWMGLDSANRNNAMQYLTSQGFLDAANAGAAGAAPKYATTADAVNEIKKRTGVGGVLKNAARDGKKYLSNPLGGWT